MPSNQTMKTPRILLSVSLVAGLASCSPKPQDVIIGKWQQVPGSPPPMGVKVQVSGPGVMTFDFRPDGTVLTQGGVEVGAVTLDGKAVTQGGTQPLTNRYSFVDDHTLKIAFAQGLRFKGREVTFRISASRNQLVLTESAPSGLNLSDAGGSLTLQRSK